MSLEGWELAENAERTWARRDGKAVITQYGPYLGNADPAEYRLWMPGTFEGFHASESLEAAAAEAATLVPLADDLPDDAL